MSRTNLLYFTRWCNIWSGGKQWELLRKRWEAWIFDRWMVKVWIFDWRAMVFFVNLMHCGMNKYNHDMAGAWHQEKVLLIYYGVSIQLLNLWSIICMMIFGPFIIKKYCLLISSGIPHVCLHGILISNLLCLRVNFNVWIIWDVSTVK